MEHDITLLTTTLVACVPASSDQKIPDTTRHALGQPMPGGQHCLVQLRWKGVIHVSDSDWHLIPNMLNWIHVWTPSWPVHDLNILLVQKATVSRAVWDGALSWTYTKLRPNTPVANGNIWFLRIRMPPPPPPPMTNIRRPEASQNGSNWHLSPKSADHLHSQTRSRDEAIRFDHSEQLTFFPWRGDFLQTFTLPLMWSASLSCVAKFCLCILETPPVSWLLLAENCHLPTTWQFAAVFALANFVAWSQSKVVMARLTSPQVTTPELTFFLLLSLSVPQTILTVFGHSIWLRKGSMKLTVFRSAIEHTIRNNKYRSNSRKFYLVVLIP